MFQARGGGPLPRDEDYRDAASRLRLASGRQPAAVPLRMYRADRRAPRPALDRASNLGCKHPEYQCSYLDHRRVNGRALRLPPGKPGPLDNDPPCARWRGTAITRGIAQPDAETSRAFVNYLLETLQ